MKNSFLPIFLSVFLPLSGYAQLVQTFESGEDTSNWGATWNSGSVTNTFLAQSLGGFNAGNGVSPTQSFSRSFKNNTAGIDLSSSYSMSMYVQLDTFDGPSSGQFEIVDGDYGTGNAGNLKVVTTGTPGVFKWQARDNNAGWLDLGLNLSLATPYLVTMTIDPSTFTYSTSVSLTDTNGNVLGSSSLANLAFDNNVINNHQNGTLLFYIQASSGGTSLMVDNININAVPEPSTWVLLGLGGLGVASFYLRRKNRA